MSDRTQRPSAPQRLIRFLARIGFDLRPMLRRYRDAFLGSIEPALKEQAARLGEIDRRLAALSGGLDSLVEQTKALAQPSPRLDDVDRRLAALSGSLDSLAEQTKALAQPSPRLDDVDRRLAALSGGLDSLAEQTKVLAQTSSRLDDVDRRLAALALSADAQSVGLLKLERDSGSWARKDALFAVEALAMAGLTPRQAEADREELLVSIILPTFNRARMIGDAIGSVLAQTYQNWELLIVDDGGADDTAAVVAAFLNDPRVRYDRQPHGGSAAARNVALARARGQLIAYIDSDNLWLPGFLAGMAAVFQADPECGSAYGVLIRDQAPAGDLHILWRRFDATALAIGNYIDLNVFVHRRALYERLGGFDEGLSRLIDWDLILRYTADRPAAAVPIAGVYYRTRHERRITHDEPVGVSDHRIRMKRLSTPVRPRPIRVLYMLFHYPQLSETYIEAEIAAMRRLGVEIAVWSANYVATPYRSDTPVHTGDLAAAISAARPDIVHSHWLTFALEYEEVIAAHGLPMTVRAHGFETTPDTILRMLAQPSVARIHLFPHHAQELALNDPRIGIIRAGFDSALFLPGVEKDRHLVVRTAAALESKNLAFFLEAAKRLPDFRFVLAVTACSFKEAYVDALLALRDQIASPAEILVNLPHADAARLITRAGIYLHTIAAPDEPFGAPPGQPISIAEAMATGCYTLVRDLPALVSYAGGAGAAYHDIDEAVELIAATAGWSDRAWRTAANRAIDHAWLWHADDFALRPVFESWIDIAERASRPEGWTAL
jgi:glycosyltransferase involved in cell wall biosynthesis